MTVSELLSRISSRELTEWAAFFAEEPFGFEVDMMGHAITASTVANVNRPKGRPAAKVSDFMPKFKPKMTTSEVYANLKAALRLTGPKDPDDKKPKKGRRPR